MVQSEVGPSGGLLDGDLEWPYPKDPTKVQFILWDSQECQLWDILGGEEGLATGVRTHQPVREARGRPRAG